MRVGEIVPGCVALENGVRIRHGQPLLCPQRVLVAILRVWERPRGNQQDWCVQVGRAILEAK